MSRISLYFACALMLKVGDSLRAQQPMPQSAAIFVQMASTRLWPELKGCIENVASAGKARPSFRIALHIALIERDEQISTDVHRLKTQLDLAEVNVTVVDNKGADIGEFLQQIQLVEPVAAYDLLLKIHSKTHDAWRRLMLDSLCGSSEQVERIFSMFEQDNMVGMVGPRGLTWTWDNSMPTSQGQYVNPEKAFRKPPEIQQKINNVWQTIYPEFPLRRQDYRMVAGTCFWSRYAPLALNEELRIASPRFIDEMPTRHKSGTGCSTEGCWNMYAFERVLATIFKAKYGLEVIPEGTYAGHAAFRDVTDRTPTFHTCCS